MKKVRPAFHIPLTPSELAMLGELCAIQGQVEHLLIDTAGNLLDLKRKTARALFASSSLHSNAKVWIELFREKCADARVLALAESAYSLVEGITKGRNDFVHAVFATATGSSWMLMQLSPGKRLRPKRNEAIALRTRDMEKKRSIADLAKVRNDAATLSNLLSDIDWSFLPDDRALAELLKVANGWFLLHIEFAAILGGKSNLPKQGDQLRYVAGLDFVKPISCHQRCGFRLSSTH